MKSKEKNALSHIVKEAMAKKKWNQLKLADASGVSQGNLSKFLTGETDKVGVKNIYNILHCLDLLCDPNDRQQEISVVTCPEDPKYADIYQDVRMIIEAGSDREDIIVALRSGIRGMLLMLGAVFL